MMGLISSQLHYLYYSFFYNTKIADISVFSNFFIIFAALRIENLTNLKLTYMTREELLKEFPTLSEYMIEKVLRTTSLEQAMESMRTQHIPYSQCAKNGLNDRDYNIDDSQGAHD